ncbi:hypothetical protein ACQ4PT_016484 [Festuca glaucescens]
MLPADARYVTGAKVDQQPKDALVLEWIGRREFDREPLRDAKATMKRAICCTFGALDEAVTVTEHFPEPYLVRFIFPHNREAAVSRHDFTFEGHKIQIRR